MDRPRVRSALPWILTGTCALLLTSISSCGAGKTELAVPDSLGLLDGSAAGTGAASGSGGSSQGGSGGWIPAGSGGDSGSGGSEAGSGGDGDADVEGPPPDVHFGYDSPTNDSDLNPDSACAASTYEATLTPLDMYVMIDRSGSMVEPGYTWTATGPGQISISGGDCPYTEGVQPLDSKWCYAIYALAGYFKSAEASGNRVALQFFPIDGYNCDSDQNNSLSSAGVQFQTIPDGIDTLIHFLNAADPLGANTPTKAALHGIAGFTAANKSANRSIIGVLITDGVPNSCAPNDGLSVGAVAGAHYQSQGIKTYVIGMTGADFSTLDQIASQGGTPQHHQYCAGGVNPCYFYNVGNGDSQVFVDVLHDIQHNAIGCTYQMPTTDAGLVDPNQISVQYQPGNGGAAHLLDKVNGQGACAANGWYYDNANPPNIVLCPQTCTEVQADMQAKVQILVACQGN